MTRARNFFADEEFLGAKRVRAEAKSIDVGGGGAVFDAIHYGTMKWINKQFIAQQLQKKWIWRKLLEKIFSANHRKTNH